MVAVVEACGFAFNIEIAERDDDPVVDAELAESVRQAPQQRVQALIERVSGGS